MRVIAGTYRSLPASNMFMFNSHYTFWEILKSLSTLQLLFFLILTVVSIYSLLSATVILVRLRSLANRSKVEDVSSIQRSLTLLDTRSEFAPTYCGYFLSFWVHILPDVTVRLHNA